MISKRSALQPVGGASVVQDPHYQVAFDNFAHIEYQTRNMFLKSDYVAVMRISMVTMMIDYSNDDDDIYIMVECICVCNEKVTSYPIDGEVAFPPS